ncbi:hypothetical protein GCM10009801_74200 [Streptomyces albiaxialis]|uniref:Secreted protein n=1 Tax=Streptomyces albiaxialis TaxID=329523 RepID=A0ABN2WYK9_9ACTN
METYAQDLAVMRDHLVGIVPLLLGIGIVIALIGAVWLGKRIRRREPAPPSPESQPRLPETGPVGEVQESRMPDEMPRDGVRRLPHEGVRDYGSATDDSPEGHGHRRWTPGNSGSFGSGGPGSA